jgi:hypothetical protein
MSNQICMRSMIGEHRAVHRSRYGNLIGDTLGRIEHVRGRLLDTGGTQLLEFALALPFLVVLAVGIMDFSQAYNTKHILTNAAREGARLVASTPLSDINCTDTTPCSIEAAADAVKYYLTNNGLSLASCITPNSPGSSSAYSWTYSCSSVSLSINKAYQVSGGAGGFIVPSTQVTLQYPYTFSLGRVIGLLVPGATSLSGQQILSTS